MKKQNIFKKISLLVLSSIMTASGVLAKPGETVTQSKHDKDPAYPKLTTKDAGKNPTTKTKKSSGGKFIGTAFATIGVLWTINKTHDLISALFGNPYFKLGMINQLQDHYSNVGLSPVRTALLTQAEYKTYVLTSFQKMDTGISPSSGVGCSGETKSTSFTIFKGLVTKMTAAEIDDLIEKGKEFAESHPEISKLLLKRFDVLLIDACEGAAEKIKSLFSPKSEYEIE